MFDIIIITTSSLVLLILAVCVIIQGRSLSNVLLSSSLFLLALADILDVLSLYSSFDPVMIKRSTLLVESLLPLTLLTFSIIYSRGTSTNSVSNVWRGTIAAAAFLPLAVFCFPLDSFFYFPDLRTEKMLFLGTVGYWFYLTAMIFFVLALMNLEATFSATGGAKRWRIKFEIIGLSSILAVLIFYFSQGLLYRTINMNLKPVISGVFIIASVLVGYSRFFRGNGVRVAVSRYVLYRSLTLLMVGLYFLILGLLGEGMRYFGVSFSRDLAIFVAFISGMVMFIVLFSEALRRKVKVFINKNFYAHKHDYRAAWLNFTERLASCAKITELSDAILTTFIESFGLKEASLYLYSKEKGVYKLAANQEMPGGVYELTASAELLSYFVDRNRVLNPADGEYVPTMEESAFFDKTGAVIMVPLIDNGKVEGLVLFGRKLDREEFNYEDYDLMKTLARQSTLSILNLFLSEELAETRELTAMARISSFVMHDLKNLTTTLALLLENAGEYIADPEFQNDMIDTISNTVNKMKVLMQKLTSIPEKQKLKTELADINLLAKETVGEVVRAKPGAEILCQGASATSLVDVEEIKKVILNLVLNALDAAGKNGVVKVETGNTGEKIYVTVIDNGCGMNSEFISNNLFRPFRTTKKGGLGIGLYQCKQIIEAHGGDIVVDSSLGKGSVFTVHLPGAPDFPAEERAQS